MKLSVIAQSPFIALVKWPKCVVLTATPGQVLDVEPALASALLGQYPQAFYVMPDEPKKKKQPVDEYEKKA